MDKGKGKVPSRERRERVHDLRQRFASHDRSRKMFDEILEKVGDSALGLARDTMMPIPQMAADIRESTGGSDKGGSSMSASRSRGISQDLHQNTVGSSPSLQHPQANGMRNVAVREARVGDVDLDEWSQQGLQEEHVNHYTAAGVGSGSDQSPPSYSGRSDDATMQAAWDSSRQHQTREPHDAMERTDGAEVVNLLSNPSLQPEMWGEEDLVDEERPLTITAEEQAVSERFLQLTEGLGDITGAVLQSI